MSCCGGNSDVGVVFLVCLGAWGGGGVSFLYLTNRFSSLDAQVASESKPGPIAI